MSVTVNHVDTQARTVSTPKEDLIVSTKGQQAHGTERAKSASSAFAVDFGKGGAGDGAYTSRKSNAAEMLGLSGEKDLTASRNMDIVLSHTLSPEDYKKAQEDGYDPSEIEAGETTTIVDHIKASLIQSGVSVSGVTDTLSREQLAEITGSEALAGELVSAFRDNDIPVTDDNIAAVQDALSRAQTLSPLTDESIYYMVENGITPAVDNLYLAEHSAKGRAGGGSGFFAQEGGYYAKTSADTDFGAMQGQIDDVIRRAGFDTQDRQIQDEAKGMIRAGVPLTPEHLKAASELRSIAFPLDASLVVRAGAAAIANGKEAAQGNLVNPESFLQTAVEIDRETKAITDDGIRFAVDKQAAAEAQGTEHPLTLRDMIDATKEAAAGTTRTAESALPAETAEPAAVQEAQNTRVMQARLQLEEVRLSMSVSVNLTMLRMGVSIDTSPMQALIDNLNRAIEQNANALFGLAGSGQSALHISASASVTSEYTATDTVSRYRLYTETNFKVEYMRTEMPVGVIGALKDQFKTDTLDDIFTGATSWKTANAAYENMRTEVRRDLGDSINKAFRNADALLKDTGLAATEDHLRAVRILGYNRMEITKESVAEVAAWDAKLNAVLEDMKPAAVLDLIRAGKNPLKMTLDALSEELHRRAEESAEQSDEKYARFLYKLEQTGQITEAERTSYIGIYRMFETLQRTDHAAIGTLLNTGADMSIRNLLTATRTMRTADGKGIDVRAKEDFQGFETRTTANAIDTQIDEAFRYYSAKADTAFALLAPEKMAQMTSPEETLLPAFAEQMETLPADAEADAAFDAEQMARIREALQGEGGTGAKTAGTLSRDAAEETLKAYELPVTAANIASCQMLRQTGGKTGASLWERLRNSGKNTKAGETIKDGAESLTDALDGEADYADIYRQKTTEMQEALKEQMVSNDTAYVDFRALSLLHRQLGVAQRMAERGSFEIPVETASGTVSMHVTLREEQGQGTGVRISMETPDAGTLSANLSVRDQQVSGMLMTTFGETPQVKAFMEGFRSRLSQGIAGNLAGYTLDFPHTSITYGAGGGVPAAPEGEPARGTGARTLFRIAKVFTEAVVQ